MVVSIAATVGAAMAVRRPAQGFDDAQRDLVRRIGHRVDDQRAVSRTLFQCAARRRRVVVAPFLDYDGQRCLQVGFVHFAGVDHFEQSALLLVGQQRNGIGHAEVGKARGVGRRLAFAAHGNRIEGIVAPHEADHPHNVRRFEQDKVRRRQRVGGEGYLVGAAQPVKEQQAGRYLGVDEEAGQRLTHAAGVPGAIVARVPKAPGAVTHRLHRLAGCLLHLRDEDAVGEGAAIGQQVIGQPGVAERLQGGALPHARHADEHEQRPRSDGLPALQRRRAEADIGGEAGEERESHRSKKRRIVDG